MVLAKTIVFQPPWGCSSNLCIQKNLVCHFKPYYNPKQPIALHLNKYPRQNPSLLYVEPLFIEENIMLKIKHWFYIFFASITKSKHKHSNYKCTSKSFTKYLSDFEDPERWPEFRFMKNEFVLDDPLGLKKSRGPGAYVRADNQGFLW